MSAPTISSEPTTPVGDGRLDAAPEAATSTVIEPDTSLVLRKARDSKVPDSAPDSVNPAPLPIKPDWAPIMEFTAADVFQHSPFSNILNLISVSLCQESPGRTTANTVGMWTMKKFEAHPPPTS